MTDAERPFVTEAVRSVLAQTVSCHVRLYVSQHNDWIEGVLGDDADAVVVRRIPMQDVGLVRNIGARESETEWVAFLDGDDVWMKKKIESQLAVATAEVDLVGVDHLILDEDGRACAFGMARFIPMPSGWLVRRDTINKLPFEAGLSQDGRWWRRYADQTYRVRLPEVLVGYRVREQSLSKHSPSKKRKLAAVKASRMPGCRPIVLAATWVGRMALRRRRYVWAPDWKARTK
jgi:hypothetical protein